MKIATNGARMVRLVCNSVLHGEIEIHDLLICLTFLFSDQPSYETSFGRNNLRSEVANSYLTKGEKYYFSWILPAYAYFRSGTLKKIHLKFTLLSVRAQKLFRYNFCCFKVRRFAVITYHTSPHCLIKSFTDAKVFVNISRSFASALT